MLKIYNTLTKEKHAREKQPFTPINKDLVNIYACGLTVNDCYGIGIIC